MPRAPRGAADYLTDRARENCGNVFWLVLTANSITFGGLLFLLSAGFSLIFGLMRIPNLTHGSLFMLGAYIGATFVIGTFGVKLNFWLAAVLATLTVAFLGALAERLLLRRLPGDQLAQVLVTLGLSFMAADLCLIVVGRRSSFRSQPSGTRRLRASRRSGFPELPLWRSSRIAMIVSPSRLWLLLERTRLGAMIRAGVDDPGHGPRRRHSRVAAVYYRLRPRCGSCSASPASLAGRFSRSIPDSIRTCCRWRWSWSFSAVLAACLAPLSAASSSVSFIISARRSCRS